jgi:gluconokinase
MTYFPRMLDKIRLHARGELGPDYHRNLGRAQSADGMCCNFLRVNYDDLRDRVLQGGSDEEILDWCFEKGRRVNAGDLTVWNGFVLKLGWRDFASEFLAERKKELGLENRADIACIPDLIEFDEGRLQ